MHWAPVVDFCSVCNVEYTHILDFETLSDEFDRMLPSLKKTLKENNVSEIRKNVNSKSPSSYNFIQENLQLLKPEVYERLIRLYEKDFVAFGYKLPSFQDVQSGNIF